MEPTKLVRQVMRNAGYNRIFTNKLKNGRTVKCYVDDDHPRVSTEIRNALQSAGIKTYDIRFRESEQWAPGDSLIVEIPYAVQPE